MKKIIILLASACIISLSLYGQDSGTESVPQIPAGSMLEERCTLPQPGEKSFLVVKSETIPCPSSWTALSQEERQLALFNTLSRISTQKGITYISRRAGYKPKILFEDSYYIDSPGKEHNRIDDPVSVELPKQAVRFVEQNDTTFGDNLYQYSITNTSSETLFEITNTTAMKYHGITCLAADELTLYMSAMQTEKGIVITAATKVRNHDKNIRIFFMNVDIGDSFNRRSESLITWYKNQLGATN
jgi:hypothetical protein